MSSLPVSNTDIAVGTPATQQCTKKGLKPSSKKRVESFRLKKSYEAQARIHREAFDDTNISLDGLLQALNDLQLGSAKQATSIPVTTRGVGFLTNDCYERAVAQIPRITDTCDVNGVYRVSLAQEQLQLSRTQEHHLIPDPVLRDVPAQDLSLDPSLAQEVQGMDTNFALTADLINATGVVDYHQQQFIPFIPELKVEVAGPAQTVLATPSKQRRRIMTALVPDPYTVTFNNLRATVVALADPATPENYRRYFVENNSIPGAIFRDFLLQNPDVIMPANYARAHLQRDLRRAEALFGLIGSKMSSLVGKCKFSGKGSPAQLCGYYQGDFTLDLGFVLSPANSRIRFARPLDNSYAVRGALSLLGEYPVDGLPRNRHHFAFRDPVSQVGYIDVDWSGLVTRSLKKR